VPIIFREFIGFAQLNAPIKRSGGKFSLIHDLFEANTRKGNFVAQKEEK
jgi:hypothetical protein